MYNVVKRNNKEVDFSLAKIKEAVVKAFVAEKMEYNEDVIDLLILKITSDFSKKVIEDFNKLKY